MAGFQSNFEYRTSQAFLAFEGLVGIGRGTNDERRAYVIGLCQFLAQQDRGVRLGEYLRFEIESGRQSKPGMGRSGIAVLTYVGVVFLAAP